MDWIAQYNTAIVAALLAGISGLFLLARNFREDIDAQLLDVRTEVDDELKSYRHEMRNVNASLNMQSNSIAVLQTEQRSTAAQFTEIKSAMHSMNNKVDSMADKLSEVLSVVRERK